MAVKTIPDGAALRPEGTVMHAEVRIGDSMVMISDANTQSPPMPANLYVHLEDVDAVQRLSGAKVHATAADAHVLEDGGRRSVLRCPAEMRRPKTA